VDDVARTRKYVGPSRVRGCGPVYRLSSAHERRCRTCFEGEREASVAAVHKTLLGGVPRALAQFSCGRNRIESFVSALCKENKTKPIRAVFFGTNGSFKRDLPGRKLPSASAKRRRTQQLRIMEFDPRRRCKSCTVVRAGPPATKRARRRRASPNIIGKR